MQQNTWDVIKRSEVLKKAKELTWYLIDGDTQKDINAVRNTEIVFKNGVGYDSKKYLNR